MSSVLVPDPWEEISPDRFTTMWMRFYERWQDRVKRHEIIDSVVRGDFSVFGPDDEELESRSPNLIQVALEDTAEAASYKPTIRVPASRTSQRAKDNALMMERLGISYLDASKYPLLAIKSFLNLLAYGLFSWVVTSTPEGGPMIEWRDPRTCFPEPDISSIWGVRRCFFTRDIYLSQLVDQIPEYGDKLYEHCKTLGLEYDTFVDQNVQLVEYFDDDRTTIAVVYNSARVPGSINYLNSSSPTTVSVILDDIPNTEKVCRVVIGQRIVLDSEPRGQFDQVVNILRTHIRLMALALDYADQAVYSDVWVKDLVGQMPYGGGSYISLGPQGAIGRVPPAVSSLSLFQELQQLLDNLHLAARYPKARLGEVDQSIVSSKGMETMIGTMNTVLKTCHTIMTNALESALPVCFTLDKKAGPARRVAGNLRGQAFVMERKAEEIDLTAQVHVDYGLAFGRDEAQAAVLSIQYNQAGFLSNETVQENIPGIHDIALERTRLNLQLFQDYIKAMLLQKLQNKEIPESAVIEVIRAVQNGDDLTEVYDKYVVKPLEQQQSQMLTGMGGNQLMPGPGPGMAGPAAPTPPPPGELLAGLLGGGPEPPETIARTSVPTGPGSFAGVQT